MRLLNPYQKNRLTIVLRSLEDDLELIRQLISSPSRERILSRLINPLPPGSQRRAIQIINNAEKLIADLAKKFELEKAEVDTVAIANAHLSVQWVTLCETNAKGLKGYGRVSEQLEAELDPHINALMKLITEMKEVFFRQSGTGDEDEFSP